MGFQQEEVDFNQLISVANDRSLDRDDLKASLTRLSSSEPSLPRLLEPSLPSLLEPSLSLLLEPSLALTWRVISPTSTSPDLDLGRR